MAVDEIRFKYMASDGEEIAAYRWQGDAMPKAVIQLAHGAGEHSLRYLEPLTPLLDDGYIIYSADHRGHGLTSGTERYGDFGPRGAEACIEDMATLTQLIRNDEEGLPVILLGHSMGAMFSQVYMLDHSDMIDALVLSGTAGGPPPENPVVVDRKFQGRTDYDWLTRDDAEVDKYIADPLCKINFKPESRESMAALRDRLGKVEALAEVRNTLPVYVFVGDKDPVNANLTRIFPLIDMLKEAGLTDVSLKVYPGGRHEMLNETNRDEVVADLKAWLNETVNNLMG